MAYMLVILQCSHFERVGMGKSEMYLWDDGVGGENN